MEGSVKSDYYRNTSEELFIKAMMESPTGMPPPTMETLGFRNLSQNFRTDSEELFKSWLNNGENNGCSSTTGIATRTRQPSRRISTEPSNLSNQQIDGVLQKRTEDTPLEQSTSIADEAPIHVNQHSVKNGAESGWQANNLFLAKAWFHSSQPMTRSRSSELRRRYAAMQNLQTSIGAEATLMHNVPENSVNGVKQEYANPNGFNDVPMCDGANQFYAFTSPSNSSSSNFDTPQVTSVDKISSVVSMLKGTLERKKLSNKPNKETVEESCFTHYGADVLGNTNFNEGQDYIYEMQGSFQNVFTFPRSDTDVLKPIEGSFNVNLDGVLAPINPSQASMVSQEPSQSESSAAAAVVSTAYDTFDDSNSGQAPVICENSRKQSGHGAKSKDIRERAYDNLKDDAKKGGLVRHGSLTPAGSVDQGDPTKKRRVERSRKMAEAKERNSSPAIPSDMQSLLKRCENLEREVRSLKLNLAFMNRKDSEQTKQIEELQKENKEIADEKERLLEEIERIIAESGKV